MANKITLIYKGMRLDSDDKKQYHFMDIDKKEEMSFSKKLISYATIGSLIECERTEIGVKGDYLYKGWATEEYNELITRWAAKERVYLEQAKLISQAKKKHEFSVDNLVQQLKDSTYHQTRAQKANFALWVYNQLI